MTGGLEEFLKDRPEVVLVRIVSVQGSSPREADTEMFVAPDGIFATIGGGQLEYRAVDHARGMLAGGADSSSLEMALGPEIGQCCGGRVWLGFERLDEARRAEILARHAEEHARRPVVQIHGAGHVGRALARFFAQLPVRTVLIDGRTEELGLSDAPVDKRLSALPEAEVRNAPAGSAFIVLTHDHALDFLLASEALARGDAAYVGLIGSKTKRVRFERFCAAQPPPVDTGQLTCPIGDTGSGDKRPEVIAAFVAAEVMTALTRADAR